MKKWILILCVLCVLCGLSYADKAMMYAFNLGELTEKLTARPDVKLYYSGCLKLENFYCQTHGGAAKRPGTYFIAETADSGEAGRVIPFVHSSGTNNVLEFGDKTIRFYK